MIFPVIDRCTQASFTSTWVNFHRAHAQMMGKRMQARGIVGSIYDSLKRSTWIVWSRARYSPHHAYSARTQQNNVLLCPFCYLVEMVRCDAPFQGLRDKDKVYALSFLRSGPQALIGSIPFNRTTSTESGLMSSHRTRAVRGGPTLHDSLGGKTNAAS